MWSRETHFLATGALEMAVTGCKPKDPDLKRITGNPRNRPLPDPATYPRPGGAPEKPTDLSREASAIWDQFIRRAFWLSWAETAKCEMWCDLYAEYRKNRRAMNAARIAQFRVLGSELGFDPGSRARLGTAKGGDAAKDADKAGKYFQ
jgi:phage terminase small subunit